MKQDEVSVGDICVFRCGSEPVRVLYIPSVHDRELYPHTFDYSDSVLVVYKDGAVYTTPSRNLVKLKEGEMPEFVMPDCGVKVLYRVLDEWRQAYLGYYAPYNGSLMCTVYRVDGLDYVGGYVDPINSVRLIPSKE